MSKTFSPIARIRSFRYAARGVWVVVRTQHNAWIHLVATACVLGLAVALGLPGRDWALLTLAIMAVWCSEACNTAIERLADAAQPDWHPLVEQAKDAAAGAVLIAAVGAAIVGFIVLGPPLWRFLSAGGG